MARMTWDELEVARTCKGKVMVPENESGIGTIEARNHRQPDRTRNPDHLLPDRELQFPGHIHKCMYTHLFIHASPKVFRIRFAMSWWAKMPGW